MFSEKKINTAYTSCSYSGEDSFTGCSEGNGMKNKSLKESKRKQWRNNVWNLIMPFLNVVSEIV